MTDTWHDRAIGVFPDTLWGAEVRSQELTPLYIERFHGPLAGRVMTTHPYWEMILVCEGEGEMLTAVPFALRPGVVCLLPPGMAHIERSSQVADILWVGLRGRRVDCLPRDCPLVTRSAACVQSARLFWEVARKAYGAIGPELDGWAQVVLSRLQQALHLGGEAAFLRLDEAITYLHAHFHEALEIAELAAQCGYSEGHFYRVFKQYTGQTPTHYLTALRMQEAQRWLLHSDLPVWRIAESVGYTDPHYFSRVFKHVTGHSPLASRRQGLQATE